MKKLSPIPSYINSIIDYAVNNYKNCAHDGAEHEDHAEKVELKITVAEDSPLFEEKIIFADGSQKLIDCWEIFDIAKTIKDDKERGWKNLIITVEEGKEKELNINLS